MNKVLKIRSPTRVRRSCLSSISNPLRKVGTVTFNAKNANTTLIQSKFIDLPLESFLFLRGEYFAFFWICLKARGVREARWGSKGGALLPRTSLARGRILASMPYVGWGCCWSTPLLREVFLRVLRFLPLLKKPAPPNSNSIWNVRKHFSEFLRTHKCSVGKQITTNYKFTRHRNLVTGLRQSANDDLSTDKIFK